MKLLKQLGRFCVRRSKEIGKWLVGRWKEIRKVEINRTDAEAAVNGGSAIVSKAGENAKKFNMVASNVVSIEMSEDIPI